MKTDTNKPLAFRRYPSTTALQCFETAARHLSFTNAAQEMHMTQSAISKQVAQLEEMLNLSLFYRTPHRISLTPAGKSYYLEVLEILKHIEVATTNLMSHSSNTELLKIVSHPTFCARWLIPALNGFNQKYPLINFDIKELVRDQIILNMPLRVLCSEECKGLCSICGCNLNNQTCDCMSEQYSNSQFAALQDWQSKSGKE